MSRSGYACPKCVGELERRPGGFFLRAHGPLPGLYCDSCVAIYSDPQHSFDRLIGVPQRQLASYESA